MKNFKKFKSKKDESTTEHSFSKTLNTSLGQKGYSILKEEMSETEQDILKKKLTVIPVTMGSQLYGASSSESGFPIFRESNKKIYMPRYFGEKEFGVAKTVKLPEGDDIDVPFNGGLRDIQIPVVKSYLDHVHKSNNGGGLLELPCAAGKCLGKDTPILMYDGTIKMVQDIVIGDILMGDDSTPRNVLSLARGKEQMYKIEKNNNEFYIVNESHILSLKDCRRGGVEDEADPLNSGVFDERDCRRGGVGVEDEADPRNSGVKDERDCRIIDIPLKEYLELKCKNDLYGFHVPILFSEKKTEIDPYEMGVILGKTLSSLTSEFSASAASETPPRLQTLSSLTSECVDEVKSQTELRLENHRLVGEMTQESKKFVEKKVCRRSGVTDGAETRNSEDHKGIKRVPIHYKCNSLINQQKLFKGIIESYKNIKIYEDYYLIKDDLSQTLASLTPEFSVSAPSATPPLLQTLASLIKEFNNDIIFLARSIGYYVTIHTISYPTPPLLTKDRHEENETLASPLSTSEFRGSASSSTPPRLQTELNKRVIIIYKKSKKNNLTYDLNIIKLNVDDYYGFEIDGNRRFVLGDFSVTHNTVISINIITQLKKKTLVIVNKEFLLNQWIERIRDFAPSARLGKIQGTIVDIEDKDIVIGMLQSISMKDYPAETYESFGLTIFDEVHHISSEVFSCALFKIVTKYMLGLSATMERKDGTTYVFKLFLGDIVYKGTNEEQHKVCVRAIEYITNDSIFNEVETDFRGNPQYSKMIVKLCDYGPRSDFILRVVNDLLIENPNNQIMIIAHNRSLLTYLYNALEHRGITNIGYYVGGMKQNALDESSTKQIVLSSYSMAAEALDIKTLSTLVMVTPKTDIIQCIGRILRVKHSQPIVVDIVDKHDLFQNQWVKRRAYYKKCNYKIRMTDSRNYKNMLEMDMWKTVFEPKENKEYFASKEQGKCLISNIDFLEETTEDMESTII